MRKTLAIAAVNLRRFLRDRSNIFFVFVFPIALILVLGSLFGQGFAPGLGIVTGPEPGPLAADLVERISASEELDVTRYQDPDDLIDAVEVGAISAGLVIPPDYDESLSVGDQVELGFVARPDGVGPTLRFAVQSIVGEQAVAIQAAQVVVSETGADFGQAVETARSLDQTLPPLGTELTVVGESAFGEQVDQFDLGAPSQLVLFMFLTGLTASAALVQARQLGITTRMLSTPTSTRTILIGEGMGRFSVVAFQGVYIMVATAIIFGVDWGDPLGALALLLVFSLVGAGAGLLLGAIFRNDQQAGGIAVIAGLSLAALGGCMVPLEVFSPTMRQVAHLTPHAWAMDGFSELVRRDGNLADVLPELGVLAAYAAVLLAVASWRLRSVLTRA